MDADSEQRYPSVDTLVRNEVASRMRAKDPSLYSFSEDARECASRSMGWTDLASNPPVSLKKVKKVAKRFAKEGFEHAILIGQDGATQASAALSAFVKGASEQGDPFWSEAACGTSERGASERGSLPKGASPQGTSPRMALRAMDSDSPVRLREVLAACDLGRTLVIVSSKTGDALETRLVFSAVREAFLETMGEKEFASRLIAITDPGSPLEARAEEEGWATVLSGSPEAGGCFSALSASGLLPAALIGVNLKKLMARGEEAQRRCGEDAPVNPAIQLAAFLFDNYRAGRDKFAFVTQRRGRALAMWVEQLVAQGTGKQGGGILPYLEVDPLLLKDDEGDRTVIVCRTEAESPDERANFEKALACMNPGIPRLDFRIDSVYDLAEQFVIWEYATAMCAHLMQVCPFDRPDVAQARSRVLEMLESGLPEPSFTGDYLDDVLMGQAKVSLSQCCAGAIDVRGALKDLFSSMKPCDYFAVNAFLPFTGEGRREALEAIRYSVARRSGMVACIEAGPQFLHSTGQLQKGGPDTGVFLVLSAEELDDVALVGQPAESLGALAEAQALSDALTLAERGRRCLHLHLPNNAAATIRQLAVVAEEVLEEIELERKLQFAAEME